MNLLDDVVVVDDVGGWDDYLPCFVHDVLIVAVVDDDYYYYGHGYDDADDDGD